MAYLTWRAGNWYVFPHIHGGLACWRREGGDRSGPRLTAEQVREFLDEPNWEIWGVPVPAEEREPLIRAMLMYLMAHDRGEEA